MEKSCANHPESMALASCKACDKSVCLMCVVDEKEGTFCSADCHAAFLNGETVAKFEVPQPEPAGVQKLESIFEPDAPSGSLPLPPGEPEPIVSEGTKWRPIGSSCETHTDTPAVANCDRCGKTVCPLCLLEASAGTFCSSECLEANQGPPPQEAAAISGKPAPAVPRAKPRARKKGGLGKLVTTVLVLVVLLGGGLFAWKSTDPEACAAFLRQIKLEPVAAWVLEDQPKPLPPLPPPPVAINNTKPPVKPPVKPPDKTDPVVKPPVKPPDKTDPVVKPPVKPPDKTDPVVKPPVKPDPTINPPVKPVKPEPIRPTRQVNPWLEEEPGSWFRVRTAGRGQVTYTDYGLKEKPQGGYVLLTQSFTQGQTGPVREEKHDVGTMVLLGEETITFDTRSYLVEVRQPRGRADHKTWALLQGKSMGAVLKSESPEEKLTATRVWDHTVRVKNRVYDCLVVEAQTDRGGAKGWSKTWYTAAIPLGFVLQETDQSVTSVIDLGSDWSKRPAFPQ